MARQNCSTYSAIGYNFIFFVDRCDLFSDCIDSSDELNCTCNEDQFACQCITNYDNQCLFGDGCIPISSYGDGYEECPDGSDETLYYKLDFCGVCIIGMFRLHNTTQCNESYPLCNEATCFITPSLDCFSQDCTSTDMLCASPPFICFGDDYPACNNSITQCSDGEMLFDDQFCNNLVNCKDGSDEMRNQPGFKCVPSFDACILPQRNLYDDVAHCADSSDLCHVNNGSCFECLDKRLLISSRQVCDGVIDCYDLSDECLCEINLFDSFICSAMFASDLDSPDTLCPSDSKLTFFNSSVFQTNAKLVYALVASFNVDPAAFFDQAHNETESIYCETRSGHTRAILCDGRPECRDFIDECECENPSIFCNESCRLFYNSFYPFGDFYCNGFEEEFAWEILNESACPRGFDEKLCPNRFDCKSGEKVNIDVSQVCNGVVDCDDGADEQNCSVSEDEKLFSSDTEMISNLVFRIAFWLNGILIIVATMLVIAKKIKLLETDNLTDSLRCQHSVILNISIADCIMGVYLLAIAVHSSIYSGYYGKVDIAWRSSWTCTLIGSLAVTSSEASCLLMVVLTAFRLNSTCDPYATISTRMWPWKMAICASWIIAMIVAALPIISHLDFQYFLHSVYFVLEFNKQGFWNASDLTKFACRFAAMSNKTINAKGNSLQTTRAFLEENFPDEAVKVFGYYSETSVCMPSFYVTRDETAWEYTLVIMTINFLAFLSIAACYISLYFETTRRSKLLGQSAQQRSSKQELKMQKRIATLIATDFLCWIPICIMSYVRISGAEFSNTIYQVTAVFLLPINSVMNPLIYSLIPETKIGKTLFCC